MAEGDFPKSDGDILFASEANAFNSMPTSFDFLNRIIQLEDRSVTLSLGADDIFADAYIDADGRQNSVTTANTTALFRTTGSGLTRDGYYIDNFTEGTTTQTVTESGTDRTDNTWGFTVIAEKSFFITRVTLNCSSSGTVNVSLRVGATTVASKTGVSVSSGNNNIDFTFSDYDNDEIPIAGQNYVVSISSSGSPGIHIKDNKTYSGTLVSNGTSSSFPGNGGGIIAKEVVGATSATDVIEHAIPSGTFSSTVSKIRGKSKIILTEGDAKIEHRLENATENSGWHEDGVSGTFTAFTSEPTKYIVRLTSKTTGSPQPGYPAINGSGVYSEW